MSQQKMPKMPKMKEAPQTPEMPQQLSDTDFDIARTFVVLSATLILPVYLALSVVSFSMGALI